MNEMEDFYGVVNINGLPQAENINGSDLFEIWQNGINKRATLTQINKSPKDDLYNHNQDPSAHPELSQFITMEADRAEAAADAATVNSTVFPTLEAGRNAVQDGDYFLVLGYTPDEAARLYLRINSGSTKLEKVYPTLAYVSGRAPVNSPVFTGTPLAPSITYDYQDGRALANANAVLLLTRSYRALNISDAVSGVRLATSAESKYPIINLVGSLTSDTILEFPTGSPGLHRIIRNATSGGFSVSIRHVGESKSYPIPSGGISQFLSNGNQIIPMSVGAAPVDSGSNKLIVSVSSNLVNIYIPKGDGYILYPFVHSINSDRGCDVWRCQRVYSANKDSGGNLVVDQEIVTVGEIETAIKIEGKSDFMGGLAHGDEILTSISMFINGVSQPFLNKTYSVDSVEFIQQSNLYEPDTATPQSVVAATNHKRWVFTKDGVSLQQTIVWSGSYDIDVAYMGMLPALRDSGSIKITDSAYRSPLWIKEDISVAGFPQVNSDSTNLNLSGNMYSVTSSAPKGFTDPSRFVNVSPADLYNKIYYSYCKDKQVTPGDEFSMTFNFDVGRI